MTEPTVSPESFADAIALTTAGLPNGDRHSWAFAVQDLALREADWMGVIAALSWMSSEMTRRAAVSEGRTPEDVLREAAARVAAARFGESDSPK